MHNVECIGCGTAFSCSHKRKYCTVKCRQRARRLRVRRCAFIGPLLVDQSYRPIARECRHCGKSFTPHMPRATCCSKPCSDASYLARGFKRKHKAKRRLLARDGETFDPFQVFERDDWHCCCCGCKTPERLRGTNHDRAPQLDHIVPLSKGGKHTKVNTQLLCKKCNQAKGSGSLYDQTILFG